MKIMNKTRHSRMRSLMSAIGRGEKVILNHAGKRNSAFGLWQDHQSSVDDQVRFLRQSRHSS
ncbi:hypothetical protein SAMN05661010_00879 [Modicisalibacter muralis]|uniref:Uncharacterized protein n=1 Tax=Modicisalibacter muralis TaxID=119000 RepID=A0A1G9H0D2_9GAMM|nr:hypothetical protein SAMN05661010_00879 [Halomonas muralis]